MRCPSTCYRSSSEQGCSQGCSERKNHHISTPGSHGCPTCETVPLRQGSQISLEIRPQASQLTLSRFNAAISNKQRPPEGNDKQNPPEGNDKQTPPKGNEQGNLSDPASPQQLKWACLQDRPPACHPLAEQMPAGKTAANLGQRPNTDQEQPTNSYKNTDRSNLTQQMRDNGSSAALLA